MPLLEKYQLSGVRKVRAAVGRMNAYLTKECNHMWMAILHLLDENQKLRRELKLPPGTEILSEKKCDPRLGKGVKYADNPPIGTRVEMDDVLKTMVPAGMKGTITGWSNAGFGTQKKRADVRWDNGQTSVHVEENMLLYA